MFGLGISTCKVLICKFTNIGQKERLWEFRLGEPFNVTWGRKDQEIMGQTCALAQPWVLRCEERVFSRGWRMTSEYRFYGAGMTKTIDFATKNVTTVKYFERLQNQEDISGKIKS